MSNKGFTLIELVVSFFIIGLLSTLFFTYYRKGENTFALSRSAYKLVQDIRRVQAMAMSVKSCSECGGIVPPGYGIFFDTVWSKKKYRLYADTYPLLGNDFFTSDDKIVEPPYIELEKGVIIKTMTIPGNTNIISISFRPPDPKIKIKENEISSGVDEVIITLALESDQTKTKSVKINTFGSIGVE